MSRFGRIVKAVRNTKNTAKVEQTAAELVQEGLEGAGETAGTPKRKTLAAKLAEALAANDKLQKRVQALEDARGKAPPPSTPSTPPESVRGSLGAPKADREKTAIQFVKQGMSGRKLTVKEARKQSAVVDKAARLYEELNKGADPDADRFFSLEGLDDVVEHTGDSHPALRGAMRRKRTPQAEHQAKLLRAHYRGLKGGQGAEVNAHIIDALKIIEEKPEVFINVYNSLSPKMQVFLDDHFLPHLGRIRNTVEAGGELNPKMKRVLAQIAYKLGIATTTGVAATKGYKSESTEEA